MTRFHNISTADLLVRERDAYLEHRAIADALSARLLRECQIKRDHVYDVVRGRYSGRKMLVTEIMCRTWPRFDDSKYLHVEVHGRLDGRYVKVPTGDGFARRVVVLSPDDLK